MKNNTMKTSTDKKIFDTGYNPKIQIMTNSYSTKYFHESSAMKNTTADIVKNKTIPVSNTVK